MKRTLYKALEKQTDNELPGDRKKLAKIEVSYSKGGMNYFNGQGNRRGVYVHFTQVQRENRGGYHTESYMLFDDTSFKVMALELKRLSQKTLDNVYTQIKEIEDKLFTLYEKMDKPEILRLVQSIKK